MLNRKLQEQHNNLADQSSFTLDIADFFAGRRAGHVGTWRYSQPLFPGDKVCGMEKWAAFVKQAKALGKYYIVNDELNVIQKSMPAIKDLGLDIGLIDMGPGSMEAVQGKIGPFLKTGCVVSYIGVDIASAGLKAAGKVLQNEYPVIPFFGIHGDFYKDALKFPVLGTPMMLMFGQTLFNLPVDPFDKQEADRILLERLIRFKSYISRTGYLVLTQDCNQDGKSLYEAYAPEDDFNLNLLHRIQRDLPISAAFDPANFSYEPYWVPQTGALSHTYICKNEMSFWISDQRFHLKAGQRLHLHNTFKYTIDDFLHIAAKAGLTLVRTEFSDSQNVAMHILKA